MKSPYKMAMLAFTLIIATAICAAAGELFELPRGVHSRWISFENITGAKGQGGKANEGRKGSPNRVIKAGELVRIAEIEGPGVIRRIWLTVRGEPEILRGMVIRMYWGRAARALGRGPRFRIFSASRLQGR